MQTTRPADTARPEPVSCRYCEAAWTTVIDRRGGRVLRLCKACRLSWTTEEENETPRSTL